MACGPWSAAFAPSPRGRSRGPEPIVPARSILPCNPLLAGLKSPAIQLARRRPRRGGHDCSAETPMALERTLSIIKPDAVAKNVIGEILSRFEKAGLRIVAAKMQQLSREQAEGFYAEH